MLRVFRFASIAFLFAALPSCGSIINGSRQRVQIASTPSGARVTIDGDTAMTTPVSVKLRRKTYHRVRIELDGYQPYDMTINRGISAWWVGSFILTGGIGVGVDLLTGGLFALLVDADRFVKFEPASSQPAKAKRGR